MTLRSPFDDFVLNTLAAVGGLLAKLDYVAGLRQPDGCYHHWGMARTYGEGAAQQAAAEAHRLLFSKVLSTPLSSLLRDAANSAPARDLDTTTYLDSLFQRASILAPNQPGKAPLQHFNSVLHALSALARSRTHTSPQAS